MKNILKTTLILLLFSGKLFSQTPLDNYLKSHLSLADLCTITHPANDCVSGNYRLEGNYVIIEIVTEFGIKFYTNLKLTRGFGDLYFTDIDIISDTCIVPAFTAFKTISALIYELIEKMNPEITKKISNAISSNFGEDPENWSDKTWALYAINLSYAFYLGTH